MMEAFEGFGSLADAVMLIGLSTTRIAVAFLLLPIFSPDTIPALVRNAVCVSLGVVVLALQPAVSPEAWNALHWLALLGKEALLGSALAFGMAAFLWAFSCAGQVLDTKLGLSNAQLTDPMSGQQVSLSGAWLGRLACVLFMSSGGFLLFVNGLLESFHVWPMDSTTLALKRTGVIVFERHLNDLMSLALLLAAPVLVISFVIDLTLGLINRHAPQVNVSALSSGIKGLASAAVWLLGLAMLSQGFDDAWARRLAAMLPQVAQLMSH